MAYVGFGPRARGSVMYSARRRLADFRPRSAGIGQLAVVDPAAFAGRLWLQYHRGTNCYRQRQIILTVQWQRISFSFMDPDVRVKVYPAVVIRLMTFRNCSLCFAHCLICDFTCFDVLAQKSA